MNSNSFTPLEACRVSGSQNLVKVLSLGEQHLTGVFPRDPRDPVTSGPLDLMWSPESGLLQLGASYNLDEMYGENYGYRSGLNQSMIDHLSRKVELLENLQDLQAGSAVLDIGSNDGTLLSKYKSSDIKRVGIDPTATKYASYYESGIQLIPDFFDAEIVRRSCPDTLFDIITSISMFYDLEQPVDFVQQVADVLAKDGIWHFEQSYMPSMLRTNSYDTICHEHLEYYSLGCVKNILEICGLKILDVQMNGVNGGSFAVTASHAGANKYVNQPVIDWMLFQEEAMGLNTERPYREFAERVFRHREDLRALVRSLKAAGKSVVGYGASTKGNVLLQFCGFTSDDITCIADVNPDKYGCFTPGTLIPILSESEVRSMRPDYMLVLPWHFKHSILQREQDYLRGGGKLIFPMPDIEIV